MLKNNHTKHLICVRHGESEYNRKNLFTGLYDAKLTYKGKNEATVAAKLCKDYTIDHAYCSALIRARNTLDTMIQHYGHIETEISAALNERNYGELTGMNKVEACKIYGADKVHQWRRGFHDKPPSGESLADTLERVTNFYQTNIVKRLKYDTTNSILIVAHGNSLRALAGHLLGADEQAFTNIEVAWCSPWIFKFNHNKLSGLEIVNNPNVVGKNQLYDQSKVEVIKRSDQCPNTFLPA